MLHSGERGSDSWRLWLRSWRWGCLGGARGQGWYKLSAELQTYLPSSKHQHRLSQRAAAATTTTSRDFNELDAFLQPTYLPPASPPANLCRSLPLLLPPWLLPGSGEREREELFIVCLLKMKGFYILMSTK